MENVFGLKEGSAYVCLAHSFFLTLMILNDSRISCLHSVPIAAEGLRSLLCQSAGKIVSLVGCVTTSLLEHLGVTFLTPSAVLGPGNRDR